MILTEFAPVSVSTFLLIVLAEMGDKSQLVCMALAGRHRHWPVIIGASSAFLILNLLAVLFGALVAGWIPDFWIAIVVALLFAAFGLHNLVFADSAEEAPENLPARAGMGIFLTTLMLIFIAEFGDKTQLAVAALASDWPGVAVWVGASLALIVTSALGVWAGRKLLARLPLVWIHRFSGVLFLGFAGVALGQIV